MSADGEVGVDDRRLDGLSSLFEAHRREIHAHCYRMTGSLHDADDLTQEVFLRAWRSIDRFERRSSPRTWLFRIATNACLDFLKSHQRRARPTDSLAETLEREAWIDPYPDRSDPADEVVSGEITDLYLAAALLHLPPRQRAAFVARDLLGFETAEAASILEASVTATNSLVQRARAGLRDLGGELDLLSRPAGGVDDEVVRSYVEAHRRREVDAIVDLLAIDVRISMPPEAPCLGRREASAFFAHLLGRGAADAWHLVPTRANGSPAIANYLRASSDAARRALSIDVLRIEQGRIAAINCFLGDAAFPWFGLDAAVPAATGPVTDKLRTGG